MIVCVLGIQQKFRIALIPPESCNRIIHVTHIICAKCRGMNENLKQFIGCMLHQSKTRFLPDLSCIILVEISSIVVKPNWQIFICGPLILFRVASLALRQSYDCLNASKETLEHIGYGENRPEANLNKTQQSANHAHIFWDRPYIYVRRSRY